LGTSEFCAISPIDLIDKTTAVPVSAGPRNFGSLNIHHKAKTIVGIGNVKAKATTTLVMPWSWVAR